MVATRSKRRRIEEAPRPTLVSILPNLVDSGLFGAAELGVLCQTSKELWRATHSDQLWASLCLKLWPCTKFLPQEFVAFQGGHRGLYKHWISGQQDSLPDHNPISGARSARCPSPNHNPMPPPAYAPSQIQLFVNLKYKEKPFISHSLTHKGLDIVLEFGGLAVAFKRPIILCKAYWLGNEYRKEGYLKGEFPNGLPTWGPFSTYDFEEVRMHIRGGTSMCCVFEQFGFGETKSTFFKAHPLIKDGQELSGESEFDLSKPQKSCRIHFKHWRERLALKDTPAASEIKSRLGDRFGFEFDLVVRIVEGGYFAVTGYEIRFVKVDEEGHAKMFDASKEEKAHGVTLLHILSELQGTDLSPELFKP